MRYGGMHTRACHTQPSPHGLWVTRTRLQQPFAQAGAKMGLTVHPATHTHTHTHLGSTVMPGCSCPARATPYTHTHTHTHTHTPAAAAATNPQVHDSRRLCRLLRARRLHV
jgi:hypothetical protein